MRATDTRCESHRPALGLVRCYALILQTEPSCGEQAWGRIGGTQETAHPHLRARSCRRRDGPCSLSLKWHSSQQPKAAALIVRVFSRGSLKCNL